MNKLSTDDRTGLIQSRVEIVERRQRGGGMTVRVADMRYLLDRIVALEADLRDALPFLTDARTWTVGGTGELREGKG